MKIKFEIYLNMLLKIKNSIILINKRNDKNLKIISITLQWLLPMHLLNTKILSVKNQVLVCRHKSFIWNSFYNKATNHTNICHFIFPIDTPNDSVPRFDNFRPGGFSSIVDTPYENVDEHVKSFNIRDLTHQVLGNRDSPIGSDQESLEKIGRWGKNTFYFFKIFN
jgi:hypothetical protein